MLRAWREDHAHAVGAGHHFVAHCVAVGAVRCVVEAQGALAVWLEARGEVAVQDAVAAVSLGAPVWGQAEAPVWQSAAAALGDLEGRCAEQRYEGHCVARRFVEQRYAGCRCAA